MQKTKKVQLRQGDVLLEEVDALPEGSKEVERGNDPRGIILAVGESSGHAHGIVSRAVHLFQHGEDRYVVIGGRGAVLRHELPDRSPTGDHGPVKLPAKKTFRLMPQREFADDMIVPVAD